MNSSWNDSIFVADSDDFTRSAHFIKAIMGCVACVPNLFLIILCLSQKTLRTKVNYMVCNLMASNILMCFGLIVYSVVKYTDSLEPRQHFGCLALLWFMLFTGFGPVWGITLTALCRALSYSSSGYWNRVMTAFRFAELRFAHSVIDLAVVCFALEEVGFKASSTQCTYQFMIRDSQVLFYYGLALIVILLAAGTVCLRNRMILRRKMNKSVYFSNPNSFNQRHTAPAPLCMKPILLITFVVLVFLFSIPRIALLMTYRTKFWTVSSASPLVTSFILPFIFLLADQDMRFAMFSVFTCGNRNPNQNMVADTKSELAMTNKGFTDY